MGRFFKFIYIRINEVLINGFLRVSKQTTKQVQYLQRMVRL